jgi:hypothetical protein
MTTSVEIATCSSPSGSACPSGRYCHRPCAACRC